MLISTISKIEQIPRYVGLQILRLIYKVQSYMSYKKHDKLNIFLYIIF